MNIEVVGTGCPTCKQLFSIVKKAVEDIPDTIEIKYVSGADGMQRLMDLGLMRSPALVVNNKVAMVGYNPNVSFIKEKIIEAAR